MEAEQITKADRVPWRLSFTVIAMKCNEIQES